VAAWRVQAHTATPSSTIRHAPQHARPGALSRPTGCDTGRADRRHANCAYGEQQSNTRNPASQLEPPPV